MISFLCILVEGSTKLARNTFHPVLIEKLSLDLMQFIIEHASQAAENALSSLKSL